MSKSRWIGGVRRYLVAGVLVWLPIIATISVVSFLLELMDRTLLLLPANLQPKAFIGFALPGLGAVFALVILFVTGILVTNLIGRQLVHWGEQLLKRIPLVGSVYGGVKSFAESVFSQSNTFRQVVMVEHPRKGIWSIGFLTNDNLDEISARMGEPYVCVYISMALSATCGSLLVVPRKDVIDLDMSVDAAMKMIITCGVVGPQPQDLPVRAAPARVQAM
jgi:uncharacterized membrane protein